MTVFSCENDNCKNAIGSRLFCEHNYGCPQCGAMFCGDCSDSFAGICPCGERLVADQFFPKHIRIPKDQRTTKSFREQQLKIAEAQRVTGRDTRRLYRARSLVALVGGHSEFINTYLKRLATPGNIVDIAKALPRETFDDLRHLAQRYFQAHENDTPVTLSYINGATVELDSGTEFGIAMLVLHKNIGASETARE